MVQDYTEEDLRGKKYNELLKISKSYGVKTSKRLKMDKLIEAILKSQVSQQKASESTSQTVEENVTTPVEETSQDELLLDVQFPECDSKDFLDSTVDETKDSVESTKKEEDAFSNTDDRTHKRSGTYEAEEPKKTKKRSRTIEKVKNQRKSTFELPGQNDVTLPMDEKQTEENSKQLGVLSDKISVRGSRRNGIATKASKAQVTKSDAKQDSKEDALVSSKRRRSQTEPAASSPWQARVSLSSSAKRRRQSVVVTPSAPAPPLRPPRQSRGTPSVVAPLRPSRQSSGTPLKASEATKVTTAASASKPVFTIGCGDKKKPTDDEENKGTQGKGGSGIPRFMSYARRLKIPNFARIHEQASQRMEALDDYMERRKARQDTIGSTTKTQNNNNNNVFQPSVTNVENVNFNFGDASKGTKTPQAASFGDKTMQGVSCTKTQNSVSRSSSRMSSAKPVKRRIITPSNARRITQNATKSGKIERSATKRDARLSAKPSPKSIKKVTPKSTLKVGRGRKSSPRRVQKKSINPGNKISPRAGDVSLLTDQKAQTGHTMKVSSKPLSTKKQSAVSFPVFGSQIKENCRPGKQGVNSPMVSKLPLPSNSANLGLAHKRTTGLTDKSNVKPLRTRDNLKTLAERKHNIKSSKEIREGQKSILKGVRLNRRFELQMANRGVML